MNALQTEWTLDLIDNENDYGNQSLIYNGQSIACSPSSIKSTITPDKGTFIVDRAVSFTIRLFNEDGTSVFNGELPNSAKQEFITYDNQRWLLLTVDKDPSKSFIRLVCIEDKRGAHA